MVIKLTRPVIGVGLSCMDRCLFPDRVRNAIVFDSPEQALAGTGDPRIVVVEVEQIMDHIVERLSAAEAVDYTFKVE